MNIAKRILSTVAAATVAATFTAVTAGAAGLGFTDGDIIANSDITLLPSDTDVVTDSTQIDVPDAGEITVEVTVPAKTFDADVVVFHTDVFDNNSVYDVLKDIKTGTVNSYLALDFYFTDSNGTVLDATGKNITITVNYKGNYNTLYYYDGNSVDPVDATFSNGSVTFVAPHFSSYVLAEVVNNSSGNNGGSTTTPAGKPGNGNGVLTGDASTTLIVVVSAIAVAALATVVVATKAKKSSK